LQAVKDQCNGDGLRYGGITDFKSIIDNLKQNSIPLNIFEMTMEDYQNFLNIRRTLMAEKMKKYYMKI